jgi:hypothetical protein
MNFHGRRTLELMKSIRVRDALIYAVSFLYCYDKSQALLFEKGFSAIFLLHKYRQPIVLTPSDGFLSNHYMYFVEHEANDASIASVAEVQAFGRKGSLQSAIRGVTTIC